MRREWRSNESSHAVRVDALATTSNVTRHDIPESELKYLGDKEYPEDFQAHPEYHGEIMPWYLVGGEHEVPVCDIHH